MKVKKNLLLKDSSSLSIYDLSLAITPQSHFNIETCALNHRVLTNVVLHILFRFVGAFSVNKLPLKQSLKTVWRCLEAAEVRKPVKIHLKRIKKEKTTIFE